ncbi:MAG TPA: NfeD family protein, partial [Gemmatimonadales bacterium]|nr:NfeD family protein [Gemmatimonadales bacterium]
ITRVDLLIQILTNPFVGALLISGAIIAIIAEIKAGASGLGVLVSFLALGLFFGASVAVGLAGWLEVLLLLLGAMLIAAEVFILPGFGVPGIVGVGLFGASVLLAMLGPAPSTGDVARAFTALGVAGVATLAVLYAWVRHLPHSGRFRGLLHSGDVGSAQGYISGALRSELVGSGGVALTDLRPSGVAEIGGERLDVVSDGGFIARGTEVVVVRSEGYRHIVRAGPQPPAAS